MDNPFKKENKPKEGGQGPSSKKDVDAPVEHIKYKLVNSGRNQAKILTEVNFKTKDVEEVFDKEGRRTVYIEKELKRCDISRPQAVIINGQAENTMNIYLESEDQKQTPMFNILKEGDIVKKGV